MLNVLLIDIFYHLNNLFFLFFLNTSMIYFMMQKYIFICLVYKIETQNILGHLNNEETWFGFIPLTCSKCWGNGFSSIFSSLAILIKTQVLSYEKSIGEGFKCCKIKYLTDLSFIYPLRWFMLFCLEPSLFLNKSFFI